MKYTRVSWVTGAALLSLVPALLLALSAEAVRAQDDALEERALGFAQAWVNGDGDELAGMMEPGGIRLHLQGEDHLSISPRQARASVLSFMERYEGGEAEISRVSQVGGDPSQGFAEIRWGCRVSGTAEPVIFTLFVAFSRSGSEWMVTEIRILP